MAQRTKSKKSKHYMQNKGGKYKNGQLISEQKGNFLTYYFKTGLVKAKGKSIDGTMEGKWIFNRESGQLWQTGHFKKNKKHGSFVRYDKNGKIEYRAKFADGKLADE
jgi:antitoxin component YwqK of YwqJK toxin-antitoxin module